MLTTFASYSLSTDLVEPSILVLGLVLATEFLLITLAPGNVFVLSISVVFSDLFCVRPSFGHCFAFSHVEIK